MIAEPDEETDDKQVKKKRRSLAQIREEKRVSRHVIKSWTGKVHVGSTCVFVKPRMRTISPNQLLPTDLVGLCGDC